MAVDQGRDAPQVLSVQAAVPCRFSEDLLDHEGIDEDEGELQEMEWKHADLLVVRAVGGHLTAVAGVWT